MTDNIFPIAPLVNRARQAPISWRALQAELAVPLHGHTPTSRSIRRRAIIGLGATNDG